MRQFLLLLLFITVCQSHRSKEGRFLSLFNTITFENAPCIGTSENGEGVCLAFSECMGQGGRQVGNCAAGFGTCCQFLSTDCEATVKHNCSIWQNPGYPGPSKNPGTCSLKIEKIHNEICFIRLDFEHLEMGNVDTRGNCATDKVSFTQGNGFPIPSMCGILTGQHMYLDAGSEFEHREMKVTHAFLGTATGRKYRYKVSQIDCGEDWSPDRGCLQWHYSGVAGITESYNFKGQYHLNAQHYTSCIRQEKGYCEIEYTPTDSPHSFHFSRTDEKARANDDCMPDYISIHKGRNKSNPPGSTLCTGNSDTADRYCGGSLNCIQNALVDQTIIGASPPFNIHVYTNNDEQFGTGNNNYGYQLRYVQVPC